MNKTPVKRLGRARPIGLPALLATAALALSLAAAAAPAAPAAAASAAATPPAAGFTRSLHPDFALLDEQGRNVLQSGQAVSTMKSCGQCHDTGYIASHAFHADLGLQAAAPAGADWRDGTGLYGRWDPLRYRFLSQAGDEQLDLSTAGWLMSRGERVVGGGPATTSRSGQPLASLTPDARNPETALLGADGSRSAWNWASSGTMEMNCFLCHIEQPDLGARSAAIRAGRFGMANTATLAGLGLVDIGSAGRINWNRAAFTAEGLLDSRKLAIQDPTNANCAACHGEAHPGGAAPIQVSACDLDQPQTATTGQVISGQRIKLSGVNLAGKAGLNHAWDVHAERQLQCTDCHHALNNPAHARGDIGSSRPAHLRYDPRTLDISQYLRKPDHDIARGPGAHSRADATGDMRRCANCHDANSSHAGWLPYVDTHMATLACEACHIPQQHAPAIQSVDWSVLDAGGQPLRSCRGVQGKPGDAHSLVTGFAPVLLARQNAGAGAKLSDKALAPYNLVTSFYWVHDDAQGRTRPVRLIDLQSAYFGQPLSDAGPVPPYLPAILTAFDSDHNGRIDPAELRLDSPAKQTAVQARLQALGLKNPRLDGQVQPYAINHGVARGAQALNDCSVCHGRVSRIEQGMRLAAFAPVMPRLQPGADQRASGDLVRGDDGALSYQPTPARDGMYLFGANRIGWVDLIGLSALLGTLLGVSGHGLLRYLAWRRRPAEVPHTHPVPMYDAYRRFWHWLQAVSILILLATGLVIHRPDIFAAISFPGVVTLHNVVAAILVINAALSFFYHLATERMREYLPKPQGFIHDSMRQALYYTTGIFKGEAHPFEKRPDDRMNPIQKLTYFGILNVLLPLQIVTGALIWGLQLRPDLAALLGGLPILAPLHTLAAWFFATFIVGHVYLTTTGPTPLEGIRAMVTGIEEVEDHAAPSGH
jgi:thiosulfate reductase cytochrome b subunit